MATPITTIVTKAPGVYVQEVSSGTAPIAGVGTSTAAFIGVCPDFVAIPVINPVYDPTQDELTGTTQVPRDFDALQGQTLAQDLSINISRLFQGTLLTSEMVDAIKATMSDGTLLTTQTILVKDLAADQVLGEDVIGVAESSSAVNLLQGHKIVDAAELGLIQRVLGAAKRDKIVIQMSHEITTSTGANPKTNVTPDPVGRLLGQDFQLSTPKQITISAEKTLDTLQVEQIVKYSSEKRISIKGVTRTLIKQFPQDFTESLSIKIDKIPEDAILCTNFGEFKASFGDFSKDNGQSFLAHSVYGFFRNGGSRCYVVRIKTLDKTSVEAALDKLATIDEIAIIAAPGITDKVILQTIADYIQPTDTDKLPQDWIAVFDAPSDIQPNDSANLQPGSQKLPPKSDRVAIYYPWIKVFDPVTKLENNDDGLKAIPPSGHIAGVYARVDNLRGVHKAPANEPVLGADSLQFAISKAQQSVLNQNGINCIRSFNGTILVWGARTLGGDKNGEFKYVNVRRLFLYLRKSIDEGTQWTVFEPNSPELWSRIRRNINAFLLTVWRSGALFGDTPEQAFYVKCDEETNPPENRDLGVVVIEIGVAVVKPAEFVVFNLSQWAGAGK